MKKLRIETLKLILVFALILGTITTSVYGWFSSKANTISTRVTGSIVFEYFHCGDGSKENPFVITRPIHYYHMVEFFQRTTILDIGNNEKVYFGKDYIYFQIGCPLAQLGNPSISAEPVDENDWYVFDYSNTGGVNERTNAVGEIVVPNTNVLASKVLNMAYYSGERALMPTGSSEIPFLGSIDGHKMTIDNLHIVSHSVVNVIEENGTTHSNVQRHTADMGVFGCVAQGIDINEDGTVANVVENDVVTLREQSSIKNLYITNATIDLEGTATSTEIVGGLPTLPNGDPTHSNDYHLVNEDGEVVEENGTEIAYVGYVAGHVFSTDDITDVYVNNCRIVGGTASLTGYGYFGVIIDPTTGDTVSSLGSAIANIYTSGDGSGFGGSIGMTDLYARLANVRSESSNIKNITAETVIIDEVAGTTTRIATAYANADAYNPSKNTEYIKYYYSPESGLYYMYYRPRNQNNTGPTAEGYNYLWGENTRLQTKTVTTITYEKDLETGTYKMVDGYLVYEGEGNYLGTSATTTTTATLSSVNQANAKVLSFDDSNHLYFIAPANYTQNYDYPYNDNEDGAIDTIYYLNAANNYLGVQATTTATSIWAFDENNRLYTTNNQTRYYLDFNNGSWYLTPVTSFSVFKDGEGNFLMLTGTTLDNTTTEANASKLELSNPQASTTISTIINGARYYLRSNAGTLELNTTANNHQWSYDSTKGAYYMTYGSTKYYIACDDGVWKMRPEGYNYLISDNGNYLNATSTTAFTNVTDSTAASYWNLDPNAATTTISTIISGTVTYLGVNNGNLALGTGYNTSWTKEGDVYYTTIDGTKFYLGYDESWKIDYSGYKLGDGNGNYINASSTTAINNQTNASNASTWLYDPDSATTTIYTYVNGTRTYLGINNGALALNASYSTTSWTKDNDGYYITNTDGIKQYIRYNNGWIVQIDGYKISNGTTNYLTATSATAIGNTTEANAAIWVLDPDSATTTIFTYVNGNKTYLGVNNGALALNASYSSVAWTKESANSYYVLVASEKAYITYDNGWKIAYEGYRIKNTANNNWLSASSQTAITNQTTQANGSIWILDPDTATTTIATIYNGTKTYLGANGYALALNTSYSGTLWTKEGNTYYIESNEGVKLYLIYDNGWKLGYDGYTIKDNSGNYYLSANGTTIQNQTTQANGTSWIIDRDENTTKIFYIYNNTTPYYLGVDTNENIAVGTAYSTTIWTKDGNSYYTTYNGINYYLTYMYGAWRVLPKEYIRISMNNYYMYLYSATAVRNTNNPGNTANFYRDSQNRYYGFYNNNKTYIRNNNNTVQASTTIGQAATILRDGNTLYVQSGNNKLYINQTSNSTYSSTAWSFSAANYARYAIGDGSGHYLNVTGTNANSYETVNNAQNATHFVFSSTTSGTISTTVDGTTYYLRNNNGTLEVSTTSTTWDITTNGISNDGYNLRYNNGNWELVTVYYVLRSGTSYMGYSGTDVTVVSSKNNSNILLFKNIPTTTGTDYTLEVKAGNNEYNLYCPANTNNSAVSLSANTRNWRTDTNGRLLYRYSNTRSYYLRLTNGDWQVNRTAANGSTITFELYDNSIQTNITRTEFLYGNEVATDNTDTYAQTFAAASVTKNITPQQYTVTKNFNAAYIDPYFALANTSHDAARTITISESLMVYGITDTVPLNINRITQSQKAIKISAQQTGLATGFTTYMPIRITDSEDSDYDANSPFKASLKNTGYIVGGATYYVNGNSVGDIRVSRYAKSNITDYSSNNNLYTVDGSGNRKLTTTDTDKYMSFNDSVDSEGNTISGAKTQFDAMIGSYADGLHFMNAEISINRLITVPQATILNRTYYNYQLPEDCIDFKVLKRGAISFFAGEYFTDNDAFFSLHQIFRDSNQNITDIKEIQYVYKAKGVQLGNADYIYLYKGGTELYGIINQETGNFEVTNQLSLTQTNSAYLNAYYEIAFNTDWITSPSNVTDDNNPTRVYYFEIPCNKGEYALGSVSGKIGAYLLYLDIAANGGDEVAAIVSGEGNDVSTTFKVDFRAPGETSNFAILQLEVKCPTEENASSRELDSRLFSVRVVFDSSETGESNAYPSGIYNIYVTNKVPDTTVKIKVFLVDDDNDVSTAFPYAFRVIYTNTEYNNVTITNIADLDYYQSVGAFEIPFEGAGVEASYD